MAQMNDLKELLKHDVQLMYNMEEQIIAAMPAMIAGASDPSLKQALEQHHQITQNQLQRLDSIRQQMGVSEESVTDHSNLLSRLVGGGAKCKGIEGIIEEGQKMMAEDLGPEVMDAAIAAGNQKIEHYEIACYGTARTFAQQLGLTDVAHMLQQTLDEEYRADERLSHLAMSRVNAEAEAVV